MTTVERNCTTFRAREVDTGAVKGSIKALRVEKGDLVVFRLYRGTQSIMEKAQVALDTVLNANGSGAIGLVLDATMDIESIPYPIAVQMLQRIAIANAPENDMSLSTRIIYNEDDHEDVVMLPAKPVKGDEIRLGTKKAVFKVMAVRILVNDPDRVQIEIECDRKR
jgi:hypothetical protein